MKVMVEVVCAGAATTATAPGVIDGTTSAFPSSLGCTILGEIFAYR